jgi:hypothetical protein
MTLGGRENAGAGEHLFELASSVETVVDAATRTQQHHRNIFGIERHLARSAPKAISPQVGDRRRNPCPRAASAMPAQRSALERAQDGFAQEIFGVAPAAACPTQAQPP